MKALLKLVAGVFFSVFSVYAMEQSAPGDELRNAIMMNASGAALSAIKSGADINSKDEAGLTPLMLAIDHNLNEVAKQLILAGADIHATGNNGETALHYAAFLMSKDLVTLLVDRGANLEAKDTTGKTPLLIAVSWVGNTEGVDFVKFLLEKGANIEAKDTTGKTPLHWVAEREAFATKDVLELLIAKGANIEAKDNAGKTPLQVAEEKGYQGKVALINKARGLSQKLIDATINKQLPLIKEIISTNFGGILPLYVVDSQGNTLLHIAIINNNFAEGDPNLAILEYLFSLKLPKLRNNKGDTALELGFGLWSGDGNFIKLINNMIQKGYLTKEEVAETKAKIKTVVKAHLAAGAEEGVKLGKMATPEQ